MKNPFSKYSEEAYGLLRIVAGFLFAIHGAQKITGFLSDPAMMPAVGTQMWFGGVFELACGLMLFIGFMTHWGAFLASGEMAVAYIQFHWKFQFDANFFPVVNHGELALVYCFLFLYIAAKGGGKWSLDRSNFGKF